jgi:hypothetical protein
MWTKAAEAHRVSLSKALNDLEPGTAEVATEVAHENPIKTLTTFLSRYG